MKPLKLVASDPKPRYHEPCRLCQKYWVNNRWSMCEDCRVKAGHNVKARVGR